MLYHLVQELLVQKLQNKLLIHFYKINNKYKIIKLFKKQKIQRMKIIKYDNNKKKYK